MNSVHYAFLALMVALAPLIMVSYQTGDIPSEIPNWYMTILSGLALYATGRQVLKSTALLKGKTT